MDEIQWYLLDNNPKESIQPLLKISFINHKFKEQVTPINNL